MKALKVNFVKLEFLSSVDKIDYFHSKKTVNDVCLMDAFVDFMPATILLWTFKTKAVVNQLLQLACFSLMWSSLSKIELGSHRETR